MSISYSSIKIVITDTKNVLKADEISPIVIRTPIDLRKEIVNRVVTEIKDRLFAHLTYQEPIKFVIEADFITEEEENNDE